jgi:hypothetical protein
MLGAFVRSLFVSVILVAACSGGESNGSTSTTGSTIQGGTAAASGGSSGQGGDGDFGFTGSGGGSSGSGGDDSCAGVTSTAELVPLDMYIMLDSSGSMSEKTGKMGKGVVKWDAITTALDTFFKDPGSVGIGVGLQFFPLRMKGVPSSCTSNAQCGAAAPCYLKICDQSQAPCSTNNDCGPNGGQCVDLGECANKAGSLCLPIGAFCQGNQGQCTKLNSSFCLNADSCEKADYATPAVGIANLPGVKAALDGAIAQTTPEGATPTSAALQGAVEYAGAWAKNNPNHVTVAVLATDGAPTRCDPTDAAGVAKIAADAAAGNPKLLTFVIGMIAPNETGPKKLLNDVAMAGGSGSAFFVDPQSQNVANDFQVALEAIRGTALACEYLIPQPSQGDTIDYGKVNVEHTPSGADSADTIFYVGSKDNCDPNKGGWYYDVEPMQGTPTKILVCPATCAVFKTGGTVKIRVGCETVVPPIN